MGTLHKTSTGKNFKSRCRVGKKGISGSVLGRVSSGFPSRASFSHHKGMHSSPSWIWLSSRLAPPRGKALCKFCPIHARFISYLAGDAPSLEAFKARLDVALGSLVWWLVTMHIAGGLKLDYHCGPFQPRPFCDSTVEKSVSKSHQSKHAHFFLMLTF